MAGTYDLVIVGMGSGGMVSAEFAAKLGLRVAVVERGRVGGDCLWTGCVPSKALIASARAAHTMRTADRFGLPSVDPEIDTEQVWKRLRAVQQSIASTDDDPARFAALGVDVVRGSARLVDDHVVEAAGRRLRTRFVLLCTGSRPSTPDVPGLQDVGFLSSENVFELERAPASVVVLGGGLVGVELSQALRRLGVGVTLLQRRNRLLPGEEPELVDLLTARLRQEGVDVVLGAHTTAVMRSAGGAKVVSGSVAGTQATWQADEVLVAAGRAPNVEGLGLHHVGVRTGPHGVEVDGRLRTSVPWVYAAGDLVGRSLFTHAAGHEAVIAVRDMFFPGRGRPSGLVPWCVFTDPELAHAGLTEAEARERHGDRVRVWRAGLDHSDRARTEAETDGAVKLVTTKRGTLVGAHVLAPVAGEVVHELALAIHRGDKLVDLAALVHVYPTISSTVGQLAFEALEHRVHRYRWITRLPGRLATLRGR